MSLVTMREMTERSLRKHTVQFSIPLCKQFGILRYHHRSSVTSISISDSTPVVRGNCIIGDGKGNNGLAYHYEMRCSCFLDVFGEVKLLVEFLVLIIFYLLESFFNKKVKFTWMFHMIGGCFSVVAISPKHVNSACTLYRCT